MEVITMNTRQLTTAELAEPLMAELDSERRAV
jgi:hypothetical protein